MCHGKPIVIIIFIIVVIIALSKTEVVVLTKKEILTVIPIRVRNEVVRIKTSVKYGRTTKVISLSSADS